MRSSILPLICYLRKKDSSQQPTVVLNINISPCYTILVTTLILTPLLTTSVTTKATHQIPGSKRAPHCGQGPLHDRKNHERHLPSPLPADYGTFRYKTTEFAKLMSGIELIGPEVDAEWKRLLMQLISEQLTDFTGPLSDA